MCWSPVTCFLKQKTEERMWENTQKEVDMVFVCVIKPFYYLWPDSQTFKVIHLDISHAFIKTINSCKLNLGVTLTGYWLTAVWWSNHWALHLAPGSAISMDFVFVNCFYPSLPGLLSTTKMNLQVLKPPGYLIRLSGKPKKEWLTLPLAWFVNRVSALGVGAVSCTMHKFQMYH